MFGINAHLYFKSKQATVVNQFEISVSVYVGQNLLSAFAPVAVMICSNPSKFKKAELQSSAASALTKFMLVRYEESFFILHEQKLKQGVF